MSEKKESKKAILSNLMDICDETLDSSAPLIIQNITRGTVTLSQVGGKVGLALALPLMIYGLKNTVHSIHSFATTDKLSKSQNIIK